MIKEKFDSILKEDDCMKELMGKFHKTSNGYESYEILDADSSFTLKVATVIVEEFHFTPTNPIIGLD
jgi:hypothetical protein